MPSTILNHHHQQQSRRLFQNFSSLLYSILHHPSSPTLNVNNVEVCSPSSSYSAAGIAVGLLGMSMVLMLCGSVTFLIGLVLMPWVMGLVMVLYVMTGVASLAANTMFGKKVKVVPAIVVVDCTKEEEEESLMYAGMRFFRL